MAWIMNQNIALSKELLSEVHRNLTMGSESLTNVLPKVQDKFLRREITFELENYAAHTRDTVALMQEYDVAPEKTSLMKTMMAKGGIALNTLFDSSDGHIADMIARGTDLGATQLSRTMDRCRHSTKPVVELARSVVDFEESCVERVRGMRDEE